jgi:hypothetical protein
VTVKELITMLLDEDMNSNVYVKTRYKEVSEDGTQGALFEIAEIESGATVGVKICFIDWRK